MDSPSPFEPSGHEDTWGKNAPRNAWKQILLKFWAIVGYSLPPPTGVLVLYFLRQSFPQIWVRKFPTNLFGQKHSAIFCDSSSLLIHQAAVLCVVLVATSLFSLKKLTNNVNEGGRGSSRGILSGQLECCPSYLLTSFHLGIQYIHREQLMFYYLLFHITIPIN